MVKSMPELQFWVSGTVFFLQVLKPFGIYLQVQPQCGGRVNPKLFGLQTERRSGPGADRRSRPLRQPCPGGCLPPQLPHFDSPKAAGEGHEIGQ